MHVGVSIQLRMRSSNKTWLTVFLIIALHIGTNGECMVPSDKLFVCVNSCVSVSMAEASYAARP